MGNSARHDGLDGGGVCEHDRCTATLVASACACLCRDGIVAVRAGTPVRHGDPHSLRAARLDALAAQKTLGRRVVVLRLDRVRHSVAAGAETVGTSEYGPRRYGVRCDVVVPFLRPGSAGTLPAPARSG